ncbi:MAG: gliding motility-associated C-terminal domain-containing protein [Salibacteraceae bacterium]
MKEKYSSTCYTNIKKFLFLIPFLIFSIQSLGTHLIGGNIGYEFVGPDPFNANNTIYKITLDAYMDCNSTNWGPGGGFPEAFINVGIYEGVLAPSTGIPYFADIDLTRIDSNEVDPNLPQICDPFNLLADVCVYLVRYEGNISLPTSTQGYWVVYDRCCRPPLIDNLTFSGTQSFAYTTWIPANSSGLVTNSSAQFTDTLLSYICRTDTSYISNNATDPDGDSLVYSLASPFIGVTGQGGTANPPVLQYFDALMNPYTIPPPIVNYAAGYSLTNLLGAGGFSSTDPNTGLTRFLTNVKGTYVASIEITEYRNGVIVGVTRRNMQLIADDCPNNNMPVQDVSNLDSTAINPLTYEVEAGLNICFDLEYNDLDGDPLEFVASSDIFNSTLTNPPATVTSPVTGLGSVTGTICWNTTCAQGSTVPYLVDVVVTDSNCPPLPLPQELYIKVLPFEGPSTIYGDTVICIDNNPSTFSADTLANVTYNWTVTGGTIATGNGTPTIGVIWNPGQTTGTLSVTSTNQNGCIDGPISRNVILSDVVSDAGSDQTTCEAIPVTIGGSPTSQNPNNTISWSPTTGLNDPSLPNPIASPTTTTTYVVSLTNARGCVGLDSVTVNVNNLIPSGANGDFFLCPGDTLDMMAVGNTFSWSPNVFISNTTIGNPKLYPPANQTYFLNYFDANGCEGNDTAIITVNSTVPTDAGLDMNVCDGDSFILGGSPTAPLGTTYLWSPATNMNNNQLANPSVLPTSTTTYVVLTSNDTCKGTDSVTVTLLPSPSLSMSADTFVCAGDTTQIFAFGTGSFTWNNGSTLSDSTINNPLAFPSISTYYSVTLTDGSLCEAVDSILVNYQSLPIADAGDTVEACKSLPTTLGGNPTGPPGSTYLWSPSNGLNFNGLANPLVTTNTDGVYFVEVTDTLGCKAYDSVIVEVFRATGNTDTAVCSNIEMQLSTGTINGNAPFTYNWAPPSAVSDPTSASPTITTGTVSNYSVTVTDANNCRDTLNFNLKTLAITTASFTYDVIPTCDGIGVEVQENSIGASSYEWYINGQLASTEENPVLIFDYNNTALVSLVTTSPDGCVDTVTSSVTGPSFDSLVNIEVSNVFTPNGDGINDFFEITSNGDLSGCIELVIFNRNGAVVHQSTGGIHTWNGRSSTGKEFPDGVYFYIYTINGKEHKGTLTLLRSS